MDDIYAMPSTSRVAFIECTGNGWENWKKADPDVTVQNTHGLVSTNEWTGVPLKFLIDLVGKDTGSTWMLAEGGDAAGVARSIPLTDEIMTRHSSPTARTASRYGRRTAFRCGWSCRASRAT